MSSKLRSIDNLKPGQGIQDIAYGQPETMVAYDLGAWFIAFLIKPPIATILSSIFGRVKWFIAGYLRF